MKKDYFGSLNENYISPFECGELKIKKSFYVTFVKRVIDILMVFPLLILTLPINTLIAVITFFDVGNPIIFIQERPGLGEEPFTIVKFRNMTNAKDENGNLLPPAERITKFGKFVRKTSLDELLQLWLIFVGKMSIIGPRPLLMEYLPRYNKQQHMRHAVRPGLECPMVYSDEEAITWEKRFENDIWYVENVSFKTDCKMFFRLILLVFDKKRAGVRGVTVDTAFMGNTDKK